MCGSLRRQLKSNHLVEGDDLEKSSVFKGKNRGDTVSCRHHVTPTLVTPLHLKAALLSVYTKQRHSVDKKGKPRTHVQVKARKIRRIIRNNRHWYATVHARIAEHSN